VSGPGIVVLKLGGSVLRDPRDLSAAVHEVYQHVRRGARVLAVVSAFHGRTDQLARIAAALGSDADPSDRARLLGVGEAESAAALTLALDRAGIPAVTLDPHAVGPTAAGDPLDADPVALDSAQIRAQFERVSAVVLPGFVARLANGAPAVLGRGGSDLTALFAAQQLGAERCILLKDVEALYERDPAAARTREPGAAPPRRFVQATFDAALALCGAARSTANAAANAESGAPDDVARQILQPKALRFARAHGVTFEVAGPGGVTGTLVGAPRSVLSAWRGAARPLRVALAGLGTVGARVLDELAARPDLFEVRTVLVRDAARTGRPAAAAGLITTDAERFLAHVHDVDVLVELCGGVQPAHSWMAHALAHGRDVVTANKAALAVHGPDLAAAARRYGRRLAASAAVGGALPALESVQRAALRHGPRQLVGFEGVLNSTTTFVLDQLHRGSDLAAALAAARAAGYAEADPQLDLDGTDLAQKVTLLARAAGWCEAQPLRWLGTEGVHGATPGPRPERLVGTCHLTEVGPLASVTLRRPGAGDPLHGLSGAGNALCLWFADGSRSVLRGRGAGAWPTATAVLADLFELSRSHRRVAEQPAEEGQR